MDMVYVMAANGFEEIEGLTVVNLLRRADIKVKLVSIEESNCLTGARGIQVVADAVFDEVKLIEPVMLVLPGGMPGTINLKEHNELMDIVRKRHEDRQWIAAICAAPAKILGELGILDGREAVCYPGMEDLMKGAKPSDQKVVRDGHIITSRGLGTAIEFALEIITVLKGKEEAKVIKESIVYQS